jgi:hypothetical protein
LDELRRRLKEKAGTDDHDAEIGVVAEAAKAAKEGDRSGAIAALRKAGTWVFKVAEELGVKLAAETIAAAIK